MFKAFTQRDWAIFTQTYGQPLRLGKWNANASEEDKNTLFNAVANIAGDCADIIPESMNIEFVESGNVGAAHRLYLERADWLDQQISKAVLGQTATTDAVTGGLGSGREHREVQEDLVRSDARALAAILNRDLIRPWITCLGTGWCLPFEHPFWQSHAPPNGCGWGCGCGCRVQGARGAPPGIDKGWDYAPGASVAGTINAMTQKTVSWPHELAKAYMAELPERVVDDFVRGYPLPPLMVCKRTAPQGAGRAADR